MTQVYCVVIVNTILMYIHTGWWLQQLIKIKINYGLSRMFITEEFTNFFFFCSQIDKAKRIFSSFHIFVN